SELPKGLSPNPSPGPLSPEKKSFLFRSTCLAAAHNVTLGTLLLLLGLLLFRRNLLLRLALLLRLLGLLLCRHAYLLLEVRTFPFRPSPRRDFLPTPQPPRRAYKGPSQRVKRTPAFWKFFFKFCSRPGLGNRRPKMTFPEIRGAE